MKALFSLQSLKEEQAVDAAMSSHMNTRAQLQKGKAETEGKDGTRGQLMETGVAGA